MPPALSLLEQQALYAMHHFRVLTPLQNRALAALIPDIECGWWECAVPHEILNWGDEEDESGAISDQDAKVEEMRALQIREYVELKIREHRLTGNPINSSREWVLEWLYGIPYDCPLGLRDPIVLRHHM